MASRRTHHAALSPLTGAVARSRNTNTPRDRRLERAPIVRKREQPIVRADLVSVDRRRSLAIYRGDLAFEPGNFALVVLDLPLRAVADMLLRRELKLASPEVRPSLLNEQ
jgi:hypothetical protein